MSVALRPPVHPLSIVVAATRATSVESPAHHRRRDVALNPIHPSHSSIVPRTMHRARPGIGTGRPVSSLKRPAGPITAAPTWEGGGGRWAGGGGRRAARGGRRARRGRAGGRGWRAGGRTSATVPPVRWTTPPPAKSIMPPRKAPSFFGLSQPCVLHAQWTMNG